MIIDRSLKNTGVIRTLLLGVLLSGCASQPPITVGSVEHKQAIQGDLEVLYPNIQPSSGGVVMLSLDKAIDRAMYNNLDARVAALEILVAKDNISLAQLEALPSVSASGTFTDRNNQAASSSESILTGTQSLEPSTSSEQTRRLGDIKAQWNLLDVAISYLDEKNADDQSKIAMERLRKVQHNIERDVVNAYWQAYAGQKSEKTIHQLSADIAKIERSIQTALNDQLMPVADGGQRITQLLGQQKSLNDLYEITSLSKAELRAISALPMDTEISLETAPNEYSKRLDKILKNKSFESFIEVALQNRPELRESYINTNVSGRGIQREVIKTLPGVNLIYARFYDSNKFLDERAWTDFTSTITQSITDIITLPKRYEAAKNRDLIEVKRRQALTAAIVAQIYVAKIRVDLAEANFNLAKSNYKISQKLAKSSIERTKLGAGSGYDSVIAKASIMAKEVEHNQAFAELQNAYVDMVGTLGLSLSDIDEEGGVIL